MNWLSHLKKDEFLFIFSFSSIALVGMAFTPLFDEDEGFFAEAARNMIVNSDFITIRVNGEWRYDKPPLYMWLEVLFFKFFGINHFAARMPSFLSFLGYSILLFSFVKKYFNHKKASLVLFVTCGILQFQVLSKAAVVDNLLNLCFVLSLFSVYEFYTNNKVIKCYLFWMGIGSAVMTKGPIGLLPLVIYSCFLIYQREFTKIFEIFKWKAMVCCLLIMCPWFYLAYQINGELFIYDLFIKHNLGRFSNTMESHGGYFYYYFIVLLFGLLPFVNMLKNIVQFRLKGKLGVFCFVWFSLVFILFSFSKTQLPHYISYGYAPLFILIVDENKFSVNWLKVQMVILCSVLLVLPLIIGKLSHKLDDVYVNDLLKDIPSDFSTSYYLILLLSIALIILIKTRVSYMMIVFTFAISVFVNRYAALQQGFVIETAKKFTIDKNIWMLDHYNPSLSFYLRKEILITKGIPQKGSLIFLKTNHLPSPHFRVLKRAKGMALVEVQ